MGHEHFERVRAPQRASAHDPFHAERGQFAPGGAQDRSFRHHHDGTLTFGSPYEGLGKQINNKEWKHQRGDDPWHHFNGYADAHQRLGGGDDLQNHHDVKADRRRRHHRSDDDQHQVKKRHRSNDDQHQEKSPRRAESEPRENPLKGSEVKGEMSWYNEGSTTASTEPFNPQARTFNKEYGVPEVTGAHRTAPFGSKLLISDKQGNPQVVVRINDRGPALSTGRDLDINEAGADILHLKRPGHRPYAGRWV